MSLNKRLEGGLYWEIFGPDDDGWLQCFAELKDGRCISVFGVANEKMKGEWQAVVYYTNGSRGNYGYAPETPTIYEALKYFAQKVTKLSIVRN